MYIYFFVHLLNSKTSSIGEYIRMTMEDIRQFDNQSYISFHTAKKEGNEDIADFLNNGTILIKKDMTALINIQVNGKWAGANERCWIKLLDYTTREIFTESIAQGFYTSCHISIVLRLKKGQKLALMTEEAFGVNSGFRGSFFEIVQVRV